MSNKWFRRGSGEDARPLRPGEQSDAERQRVEAAQRIVEESLARDHLALELAAKTIFRAGSVR